MNYLYWAKVDSDGKTIKPMFIEFNREELINSDLRLFPEDILILSY